MTKSRKKNTHNVSYPGVGMVLIQFLQTTKPQTNHPIQPNMQQNQNENMVLVSLRGCMLLLGIFGQVGFIHGWLSSYRFIKRKTFKLTKKIRVALDDICSFCNSFKLEKTITIRKILSENIKYDWQQ